MANLSLCKASFWSFPLAHHHCIKPIFAISVAFSRRDHDRWYVFVGQKALKLLCPDFSTIIFLKCDWICEKGSSTHIQVSDFEGP